MSIKTFRQALNEALHLEMSRDKNVIVFGEDVCGGTGGTEKKMLGVGHSGVTKGLLSEFGPDRIMDTPITESAFVGAAVGAAMTGLRPVTEIMFVDFLGVCFDQILIKLQKYATCLVERLTCLWCCAQVMEQEQALLVNIARPVSYFYPYTWS